VSEQWLPIFSSFLDTVNPGVSVGKTIIVTPAYPALGSVFVARVMYFARVPFVMNVLAPLMT